MPDATRPPETTHAEAFLELAKGVFALINQPMPAGEINLAEPVIMQITINGRTCAIAHDPTLRAGEVQIVCPQGTLPEDPEAQRLACRNLLFLNSLMAVGGSGFMMVDPDSLTAMHGFTVPLPQVTPRSLLAALSHATSQPPSWEADIATGAGKIAAEPGNWVRA